LKCPTCSFEDTKVLESRLSLEGRSVRRRRCCINCNYRFTTYEKEEDIPLQVQKKDGSFEAFSRTKVAKAIQAACIKRPVSLNDIEAVVAKIERMLQDEGDRIIQSRKIGDITIEHLKRIDHVAYVRFASIYKDFKDPEEFRAELEHLSATETETPKES
jgi:transcriptional repressor NrdR